MTSPTENSNPSLAVLIDADNTSASQVRDLLEEIAKYGHPLPDAVLASALRAIAAASPSAIGVDLYRDAPRLGQPRPPLRRL